MTVNLAVRPRVGAFTKRAIFRLNLEFIGLR